MAAEAHQTTDDGRVTRELTLPVFMRKHDDWMSTGRDVVFRSEQSANPCTNTEQREVITVHELAHEGFDMVADVAGSDGELRDRDLRERVRRRAAEVDVVWVGERRERKIRLTLVDRDDPLGLTDWRSSQEDCVHQTEDRAVRSNAQREREHGHERKAWALACPAEGEADVVAELGHGESGCGRRWSRTL